MLRYPASRIALTSSDVAGIDHRMAARQSAQLAESHMSNVGLCRGPERQTKLVIIPAEDNKGMKRARSIPSEAIIYSNTGEPDSNPALALSNDNTGTSTFDTPYYVRQQVAEQSNLGDGGVGAIEGIGAQRQSLPRALPRRQVDSFFNEHSHFTSREVSTSYRELPNLSNEDTCELEVTQTSAAGYSDLLPPQYSSESSAQVWDSYSSQLLPEPPALSSSRARRRHAYSQDVCLQQHPHDLHPDSLCCASLPALHETGALNLPPAVPDLVTLDPGAPVFVPRTRFGSTTGSTADNGITLALEPRWSNFDSTHSSCNLRTRPLSEQNIDLPSRRPHEAILDSNGPIGDSVRGRQNGEMQPRHRRRSRTSEQNTTLPREPPNLERYPMLLPPSSVSSYRRSSVVHGPAALGRHSVSRPLLAASHRSDVATPLTHRQPFLHVDYMARTDGTTDQAIRSVPSALSTASLSTPNLLYAPASAPRVHNRSSSLSWIRGMSRTPGNHHTGSMASTATGGRMDTARSRGISVQPFDAATEFLRMRNSPLDELTERFSRISTRRPRSVGHSWERPWANKARVSLLTGDPFRQESFSETEFACTEATASELIGQDMGGQTESILDSIAAAFALPPSSPAATGSLALQNTSPIPRESLISPRAVSDASSAGRTCSSPEAAVKRKPVSTALATPKVKVYEDSKPCNIQPQTPADINKPTRCGKNRSDTVVPSSPIFVGRSTMQSSPPIPERHPHRYTYPPASPSQSSIQTTVPNVASAASALADRNTRPIITHRTRHQRHPNSEEAENDLESHLHGLEDDRRTWISRREGGTLDVTPPKEGRFERYLS